MHDLIEIDAADEEDGGEREHDEEAEPGGADTVVNVQGLRGGRGEKMDQGGASTTRRLRARWGRHGRQRAGPEGGGGRRREEGSKGGSGGSQAGPEGGNQAQNPLWMWI